MNDESQCARYEHHKFASVNAAIREDMTRFVTFTPDYRPARTLKTWVSVFFQWKILCLFIYRIGHYLHVRRWKKLARFVARLNLFITKANIPSQSCIGPGCFLGHCVGTSFYGMAGRNLTIFSLAICCPREDSFGDPAVQFPRLGDSVTLGAHAVVLGAITIGDNVKFAPGTVITVDCPSNTVVASTRSRPTLHSCGLSPEYSSKSPS
jgi:serine O-acetyltransferase